MKTALLLSGGIDSSALMVLEKPDIAFTINYGQKCASAEIAASEIISSRLKIPHKIIDIDCSSLGSGDLAGIKPNKVAPSTEWWPFRNQLLLTLAAMQAVNDGVSKLIFGAVITDSFHVDGTSQFFKLINEMINLQEGKIRVEAPALAYTSAELIIKSKIAHGLLAWTHSCHTGDISCGQCRGCIKRVQVLREVGFFG